MSLEQRTSAQFGLEYKSATEDCAFIRLPNHSLIVLTGADRLDWLQGQATNDVRGVEHVSFCLCSAKGQIEAIVDARFEPDRILLSSEQGSVVLRRIEQMVIMEEVEGRLLSGLSCVRMIGPDAHASVPSGAIAVSGSGYIDVWLDESQMGELCVAVPEISGTTYNIWRLEEGLPVWGADATERTLPPELGPAFEAAHVSYTKGCYTGQEVLQRIHSRGHTNKTWVGLLCESDAEVGAEVRSGEAIVGAVSTVAHSPRFGAIAAATVRNEAAETGAALTIGNVPATVRPFPLRS